uniref:Thioredoxin-like 4A n=1 Tax=Sinocyclocheilus rhinocerous TaxID=307959 RepID=A0A673LXK3_9TELE
MTQLTQNHVTSVVHPQLYKATRIIFVCKRKKKLYSTILLRITLNKHIMIDLGTGNNNKINWTMEDKQEMIDIVETVYRGARKGRGLVVSPKDYSTKYRY